MNLDIEKSIKYVIQDASWKKKCLIGAFFSLGFILLDLLNSINDIFGDIKYEQIKPYLTHENIILLAVTGSLVLFAVIILTIFLLGYDASNTNLRIVKPDSNLLNWGNFGNLFKVGLKSALGLSIYIIILLAILLLTALPLFVLILIAFKTSLPLLIILSLLAVGCVLLVCCIWTFYIIAAELAFYTDLKFKSFFNFSLIKRFLIKNFLEFFIFMILAFAVNALASLINVLLLCTIVGIFAIPFIRFYSFLILNDLSAQFIRQSLEIQTNN